MNRRQFLKNSAKAIAALGMSGTVFEIMAEALGAVPAAAASPAGKRSLVVVQLTGGNDGINTVVPYGIGAYYDYRPTISYKQSEVLPINQTIGFQSAMSGFKKMYDEGNLAIIQGVGYPEPDRSHFRAQEIWQTAAPETFERTGWLGRYLDMANEKSDPLAALSVGQTSSIFYSALHDVPLVEDVRNFRFVMNLKEQEEAKRAALIDNMYRRADANLSGVSEHGLAAIDASKALTSIVKYKEPSELFPSKNAISQRLSFIADCIESSLNTKVYYTEYGSFDEHEGERNTHANLLRTLDQNIYAFYEELKRRNLLDKVTVLFYSEFGRRIKENGSAGTDHGTAGPVFVLGGQVKGGVYGEHPNFGLLDVYGDFMHVIDFRSVYATLLEEWLGVPSKEILLGKSYEKLGLFNA
jgi:uncharacterized protein (DUF1501 family)